MQTAGLDVVVVGGGPVGLATAIAARQAGLSVRLVEAGTPPRDKACGEGLMPDAVAALATLGVDAARLGTAFAGIRFVAEDGRVATGDFAGGAGCGVRRLDLHQALADRAAAMGVLLDWGMRVTGLLPGSLAAAGAPAGVTTAGEVIHARFVVAADGLRSPLRRWAGLDEGQRPPAAGDRFGVRCHFALPPWSPYVEVHWGAGGEAYVTPVGGHAGRPPEVGVALLFSRETGGRHPADGAPPFARLLAAFPALAARLAAAEPASLARGAGPLRQRVRRVARGRLALVGDAAGYVDALTGEGLGVGFTSALALAEELARAVAAPGRRPLAGWETRHRALVRWPFRTTEALLLATRWPGPRRRLLATLADREDLFATLLAALTEHRAPSWRSLAGLGWGLLRTHPV
jgi:flavin-dependent dehydrogenase